MRAISFHGCSITKFIIFLSSILSLIDSLTRIFINGETDYALLKLLRLISVPMGSQWMICVTILYQTHHLEKHLGSDNFMHSLLSSIIVSLVIMSCIITCIPLQSLFPLQSGYIVYVLLGLVVAMTILKAKATHTRHILRIPVSSHVLLLVAISLLLLGSPKALHPIMVGVFGIVIVHYTRLLPIPRSLIRTFVKYISYICEESPPHLLTGATLNVQRQQRMDLFEGYLLNIQQRSQQGGQQMFRVNNGGDGNVGEVAPYAPTDAQVQQLSAMGFRPEECHQALIAANGNIAVAVQLLTIARPNEH